MKFLNPIITAAFLFTLILACEPADQPVSLFESFELEEMTVDELRQGYEEEQFTIREVVEAYLGRIEQIDRDGPALNAILHLNPEALVIADELDQELQNGEQRGPMHGVPVVLKDNIDTADRMPTTAGAKILEESIAPDDSHVVKQLRESGAVIIGKANLSEWANFHSSFSSSGWSRLGGQTKNPYDPDRNPCGSSSGSAVAAAANMTMVAVGTETNGSIVCPSSANGIVGIKPTVGLISRTGIIPISHTMDTAGPMTRTVRDGAIALGVMAGADSEDPATEVEDGKRYDDYTQFLTGNGLEGKRIGFYTAPLDNHFRVDSLMQATVEWFEEQGTTIVEIDQISEENISGDSFQVLLYEFKDGLDRYFQSLGESAPVQNLQELVERIRNDPEETRYFDRNLLITASEKEDLDSEEYRRALDNMLTHSREQGIDRVMNEHELDAIISPTGSPAWMTDPVNGDNFKLSSSSPAARAGYPNITLPMGSIDGLPVGVSIFGRAWSEPVLLEIAYTFEQGVEARIVPQSDIGTHGERHGD